jgi:predicted NAD/FAD-binding protein
VTVFEADSRIGGHSNTVDVPTAAGVIPVDTGFIVYNEVTYPNLTRLFDTLNVPTEQSDMSFSLSLDGEIEYGASVRGILAQPSNLTRPRFVRMLADIERFRRTGAHLRPLPGETIGGLLLRHGFGSGFTEDYLYPMTGAIWSASRDHIARYPAESLMRFLHNHGLVEIVRRPRWRTVTGGSRRYVDLLTTGFRDRIFIDTPVTTVRRDGGDVLVTAGGVTTRFDQIVFASHSDQTLEILGADATHQERRLLGAIRYQPNVALLHGDVRLMPLRRKVWSSWNAMASRDRAPGTASVTYWMNRLQNLDPTFPLFVSLNPHRDPDPDLVYGRFEYSHPRFDQAAIDAQTQMTSIQGAHNTWFAGAYLGYGFHEDGLQSGLNVAAALGSRAPWYGKFEPVSSALPIEPIAA